jgi:cell division protein FtsL
MINQTTYVTRRGVTSNSFARNRNTVRHTKRSLGSISQIVIVSMLTLIFGLIYVAEGTKATSFDYELSSVESEISEMTTRKDDLAVEKARLNSVATAKNSTVAANMEDAVVSGYATE